MRPEALEVSSDQYCCAGAVFGATLAPSRRLTDDGDEEKIARLMAGVLDRGVLRNLVELLRRRGAGHAPRYGLVKALSLEDVVVLFQDLEKGAREHGMATAVVVEHGLDATRGEDDAGALLGRLAASFLPILGSDSRPAAAGQRLSVLKVA